MSNDRKLTKAEALRGLMTDLDLERAEKEAASMTEEELVAAEKADGAHEAMESVYANVDAMFKDARSKLPPENVRDIRSARRWSTMNVITTGLSVFAATACFILVLGKLDQLPGVAYPTKPAGPTAGGIPRTDADDAREMAFQHCAVRDYEQCLWWLDTAKRLDPRDEEPVVAQARAIAVEELAKQRAPH